jgi:hypothetical protein
MNRLFHVLTVVGVLATCRLNGTQTDATHVLTVRVYNYAGLEKWVLMGAQRQVESILKHAGAESIWFQCATSPAQIGNEPRCAKRLAGSEIVLKLLSDEMAQKANQPLNTFGFAVPTSPLGLGSVSILVKKAEQLAFSGPFSMGYDSARVLVLGHVIVHEIGHLLLGPKAHSLTGIMSCPWSKEQIKQIATTHLLFTEKQAVLIRDRLAARDNNR